MHRRDFLTAIGVGTATVTAPAFVDLGGLTRLGSSDTLTPLATAGVETDSFGAGHHPSFICRYDADATDDPAGDLESWADEKTDDFRVIREYDHLDALAVSMPWSTAGVRSLWALERVGGGLEDVGYLEYADANAILERPAPIDADDLASESAAAYGLRIRDRVALRASAGRTSPPTDGLAFDDDAHEATLLEARQLVQASETTITDAGAGAGVTVAVIDTGVIDRSLYEDDEGERRILPASADVTTSGDPTVESDGYGAVEAGDDSLHGDWVSACILSNHDDEHYRGFAPEADLLAIKALDDDGGGSVEQILAGVDLAIDEGADVICMSLGSPQWSEALADALTEAYERGAVPVVATGNDRYGTTFVAAPASAVSSDEHAAEGFGVNATNVPESGAREDTNLAYFGNIGPAPGTQDLSDGSSTDAEPTLAAPGMKVRISPIGTLTGTSMAAPMVAGAATLLAGAGHDADAILERLTDAAYPVENFGTTEAGHGLLDVAAALEGHERDPLADERTDAARTRDEFNRALSDSRGRFFAGLL